MINVEVQVGGSIKEIRMTSDINEIPEVGLPINGKFLSNDNHQRNE